MIEIRIQKETMAEVRDTLRSLLGVDGKAALVALDVDVQAAPPEEESPAEYVRRTEPAPEPEAPKRKRRTKAEIEADKAAEAEAEAAAAAVTEANISASPEDREDPEADDESPADEDDMIDGYAITDAGLVAAMQAYVAKFDMAAAQRNAKTLFGGYTKRSEVTAAGESAIAEAIANFAQAVRTGEEV